MKTSIFLAVALLLVAVVPMWSTETPCSDAMNAAFSAAEIGLYAGFLADRSQIASDFRSGNRQCERDHSNQEDIDACKVLVRARARARFRNTVNAYRTAIQRACNNYDPYQCRHTETPRYSSKYRRVCQHGIIRGLPARNPY